MLAFLRFLGFKTPPKVSYSLTNLINSLLSASISKEAYLFLSKKLNSSFNSSSFEEYGKTSKAIQNYLKSSKDKESGAG